MITPLESDILECKVKWALVSTTMNKLVEVMEFQLSYFKSLNMLWKCCTQYASKFGKLSSGYRTGKGQFSFQSQRLQFTSSHDRMQWDSSTHLVNPKQSAYRTSFIDLIYIQKLIFQWTLEFTENCGQKSSFMEIFFFIEKLKTWVHQIKPISGGKKSKPTIEKKKVNTVWAISEPRKYIL